MEVFIVTAAQSNIVRVPNGPVFKGTPVQDVFVINAGGNAERRTVKVGLSNFDYVEMCIRDSRYFCHIGMYACSS